MTSMKIAALGVSALVALALSSCAAQGHVGATEAASESASTSNPNAAACDAYAAETKVAGDLLVNGSDEIGRDAWQSGLDGLADGFDKAAVLASGPIADRMNDTVANFPSPINRIMTNPDQYIADTKRVKNACDAAGIPTDNFVMLQHGS